MGSRPVSAILMCVGALMDREDVVLRDGSTLRLRPTNLADERALIEFFERLTPESRYLRFQGTVRVDAHLIASFLQSDGDESLTLVGELIGEDGAVRVIGVGTWIRLRDPSRAEVAFVVADEFQRRGIASRLLERLAAHARPVGIDRFVAQVLPENAAMLHVFGDTGFEVRRRYVDGAVEVEFALATTAMVLDRMAERDHSAVSASLGSFFKPASVAVIGASARRGTIGGELFRNVIRPTSQERRTRSTRRATRSGAFPGTARSRTCPRRSTSQSSASRAIRCTRRRRLRFAPAFGRSV